MESSANGHVYNVRKYPMLPDSTLRLAERYKLTLPHGRDGRQSAVVTAAVRQMPGSSVALVSAANTLFTSCGQGGARAAPSFFALDCTAGV